jgi:hypothetical protein
MTSNTTPRDRMYRTERAIRNYALHLALMVRRRGSVLALYERSDQKRKIGEYRTWAAVERAIVRYGDEWLLADLTKLSMRQLRDEAEAVHTANIVDGAALAVIESELRRRKGAALRAKRPVRSRAGNKSA